MHACMPRTPALTRWGRRMEILRQTWTIHWNPWVWYLAEEKILREEKKKKEGRDTWELWVATLNCVIGWLSCGVVVQGLESPGKGQQLFSKMISTDPTCDALLNSNFFLEKKVNNSSMLFTGAWPVNWCVRSSLAATLEMASLLLVPRAGRCHLEWHCHSGASKKCMYWTNAGISCCQVTLKESSSVDYRQRAQGMEPGGHVVGEQVLALHLQ